MSMSRQRILLFAHYNWRAELSDHVLYTLQRIRPLVDTLVVISNTPLCERHHAPLQDLTDLLLVRENEGFDFGAWKAGLEAIGWDAVRQADSLTLMNDSCFGPLFELEPLYRRMADQGVDFWGLTNHRVSWNRIRWRIRRIPSHLQSYFLVFHRPVLQSPVFSAFWRNVGSHDDIWDVIIRYEVTLTRTLRRAGFSCAPAIDTLQAKDGHANWSHYHPDWLIERKAPFIKVKSFLYSFHPHLLLRLIENASSYPVALITEHIESHCRPDISARLINPALFVYPVEAPNAPHVAMAVHLHVCSMNCLAPYLEHLQSPSLRSSNIHVYFTAESGRFFEAVTLAVNSANGASRCHAILEHPAGQHPWTYHADRFHQYDAVGYFRIDHAEHPQEGEALVHHRDLASLLFGRADQLVASFERDKRLGLICVDPPYCERRNFDAPDWRTVIDYLKGALSRIYGPRKPDLAGIYSLALPHASCFWYRPAALAPLLGLFEEGPTTPAHAPFEDVARALKILPLYVAWRQAYRFAIVTTPDRLQPVMSMQLLVDETERRAGCAKTTSLAWRVGHCFLFVPYYCLRGIRRRREKRFPMRPQRPPPSERCPP